MAEIPRVDVEEKSTVSRDRVHVGQRERCDNVIAPPVSVINYGGNVFRYSLRW